MKTLTLFLAALEEELGFKVGHFIPIVSTVDTRFPAIKKITIEIYHINGGVKYCISTETNSYNSNEISKEESEEALIKTTIKNVLRYYGI